MTNAVAYGGVGWDVLRNVQLAAGYRFEVSTGTFFTDEGFASASVPTPNGSGTRTVHGPFGRLSASFGGI